MAYEKVKPKINFEILTKCSDIPLEALIKEYGKTKSVQPATGPSIWPTIGGQLEVPLIDTGS